jgi:hypothetical protein
MRTAQASPLADPGTEPEALIREARRRQRRRWLAAGVAMAAVLAGTAAAIAGSRGDSRSRPPGQRARPTPAAHAVQLRRAPPGPILADADTTVVTWPVGYPAFGSGFAPPAFVDDLSTGLLSQRQIPGIIGCDCQPYAIDVGRRLVYVGSSGTMAIDADLKGQPRVLGATGSFAPSAAPDHVWLVRFRGGYLGQAPVSVLSVSVAGGRPGPVITLPAGAVDLVDGTDAGLLLEFHRGLDFGLALWNPGSAPVSLPYSPLWGDGFEATARLVAYGTGCSWHVTALDAPQSNTGYRACNQLRILNVETGSLSSFARPPGTAGWVPGGFNTVSAISPGDQMIAAYVAVRPQGNGRVRLYVMRLGSTARARAVPSSSALLFARTAWSAKGSWLLYQGLGGRLWAYQVTSGKIRASGTPCCQYTVMVAAPIHSG